MSEEISAKLDIIIALLARETIGIDYIRKIVTAGKKKGKPEDFIKAYNSLGEKTITELAKDIGISQPGFSSVVSTWEKKGIIYNIGTSSQPKYRGVVRLAETEGQREITSQTEQGQEI